MITAGRVVGLIQAMGGGADPAVIESAVQDWLDNHPEATTTVQDGSITEQKLATTVAQKLGLISSLSDEIVDINGAISLLDSGKKNIDLGWQLGAVDANGEIISSTTKYVSKKIKESDIVGDVFTVSGTLSLGYVQRCYWKSDNSYYSGTYRYTETTVIEAGNDSMYYVRYVVDVNDIAKVSVIEDTVLKKYTDSIDLLAKQNKNTLITDYGIDRYTPVEFGTITVAGVYQNNPSRCRTPQNVLLSLSAGDIVKVDSSDVKFMYIRFSSGSVVPGGASSWSSSLTIGTDGTYAFVFKNDNSTLDPVEIEKQFAVIKKNSINQRVDALEKYNGEYPAYYGTQLATAETNAINTLKSAGNEKSAFIFVTDQHTNTLHPARSPELIREFIKNVPTLSLVIGGGDIIGGTAVKANAFNNAYNYIKALSFLDTKLIQVYGNHDNNGGVSADFTPEETYACLQGQMEQNPFIKYGQNYYFYFDNPMEHTRYLCANTGGFTMYVDQLTFFRDALKNTPDDWHIVLITHIIANPNPDPDDPNHNAPTIFGTYVPEYAQRILDLMDAYNVRGSGTMDGADSSLDHVGTPISYDFSNCGAKVEGVIAGHLHADIQRRTTGGIPILICDTEGFATYGDYPATAGTVTETAISIIIFDYVAQKLKMFRIGRGIDITMDLDT